jgi:hypothetical protein
LATLAMRHATAAKSAPADADDRRDRSARRALITFIVIQVVALLVLLYLGRHRWFRYDDWDFVSSRSATSLRDLLEPHNVHWSTLPIIVYRGLWRVVGLRSYLPYQLVGLGLHLVLAGLVRLVMVRAGVRAWTATAAAALLVFFGAGEQNVLWPFSAVTFTLTLVFGVTHLLLADHDGPIDRRDWFGLLAGLAGLMSSGVAITMTVVVGIAVVCRRGWRIAALHTVPLAAIFGIWYLAIGEEGFGQQDRQRLGQIWGFFRSALGATYTGIARVPALSWVLGGFVAVGLVLAWHDRTRTYLRQHAAVPAAMLVGAFLFLLVAGTSRAEVIATETRYAHVAATLTLPALAVAADAVMRKWRVTTPLIVLVFIVSAVGNLRDFDRSETIDQFEQAYRQQMLRVPRLPIASEVPRGLHPDLSLAPWVTMGWLRDGVASGQIPAADPARGDATATAELRLALVRAIRHRPMHCESVTGPIDVRLQAGGSIKSAGAVRVTYTAPSGAQSQPVDYEASIAQYFVAFADLERLRIEPQPAAGVLELCDRDGAPLPAPAGP